MQKVVSVLASALPASKSPHFSFPSSCRLLHRHDFARLSAAGKKLVSRHFVLLIGEAEVDHTRLGITVSKKVGCAVVRNRVKRLVRECFRLNRELWPGVDVVVIARPSAATLSYTGVHDELATALLRVRG